MHPTENHQSANNCVRPPHFPPHCGCPAGFHPADKDEAKGHPQ